jgi:hypothetical protein
MSRALRAIEGLARFRPAVLDLAMAVSLAARIEPELLRTARLRLLPHHDAGVEADLWFSPLVESRNPIAMVLAVDAAEELRRVLLSGKDATGEDAAFSLDDAWAVVNEVHKKAPPTIKLIERLTWLSLTETGSERIEEELRPLVVAAFRDGRREYIDWAHRVHDRLQPRVRATAAFGMLLWGRPEAPATRRLPTPTGDLKTWILSQLAGVSERATLCVGVEPDAIVLGVESEQADYSLSVPDTDPVVLDLRPNAPNAAWQTVIWTKGASHRFAVDSFPAEIRAATGEVYSIPLRVIDTRHSAVRGLAVLKDGNHALSGSEYGTLCLWDLTTGEALRTLQGHRGAVNAVAVVPDDAQALSGSEDGTLRLWDLHTGEILRTLEGHRGAVNAVAVMPDGARALSGSEDGALRLWDLHTGEILRTLEGHRGSVNAVAVIPDGRHWLSASDDNTLRMWDLDSGPHILAGHTSSVNSVAVLPDAEHAVTGSSDHTLRLWDLVRGNTLRVFEGHTASITAVAVTGDGRCALSASQDRSIRVWDIESGEMLQNLAGHNDVVTTVAVVANSRRLVSGSVDGSLRLWDLAPLLGARVQARRAEQEKQRAEAARRAEEEKQQAEATRRAEEEKQRAEATGRAEEEKHRAEEELPPPKLVRILISSPSDVAEERKAAAELIEQELAKREAFRRPLRLHVLGYDDLHSDTPFLADRSAQASLDRGLQSADAEIVVAILWARMGTPVRDPSDPARILYQSGTEQEVEEALNAGREVLIYFRRGSAPMPDNDDDISEVLSQRRKVRAFRDRLEQHGRGVNDYQDVADFKRKLAQHLDQRLTRIRDASLARAREAVKEA